MIRSARFDALLAAVLFGAGTPLAKRLLAGVDPLVLAGLLYAGAGVSAAVALLARRGIAKRPTSRHLTWRETIALAGAVTTGGVAAPILMMYGLSATPAGTASLLLNLEAVSTTLIAAAIFAESIRPRIWLGVTLITAAACLLAWRGGAQFGVSSGAVSVVAACVLWGIDNNLTRLVSGSDAMRIVLVKGAVAGAFSLGLATILGSQWPSLDISVKAVALGAVSYGASIALFVRALRELGAARTGGLFATAPFVGALLSVPLLSESPSPIGLAAFPVMGIGAYLLLTESRFGRISLASQRKVD